MDAAPMPVWHPVLETRRVFWHEQSRDREHVLTDLALYWSERVPAPQVMEEISGVATVPHVCDQPEAVGEVIPGLRPVVKMKPSQTSQCRPWSSLEPPTVPHGSSEAAAFKAETIVFEATCHLKTPCAKELVANDSFSEMIRTIFDLELGMKLSMTSADSVEVISAAAIRISLSTPGCDLVAARISS